MYSSFQIDRSALFYVCIYILAVLYTGCAELPYSNTAEPDPTLQDTPSTSQTSPPTPSTSGHVDKTPFRFLVLESLSEDHFYLDTIVITTPDGETFFPTTVEDFGGTAPGGDFTDYNAAIGPPDSRCQLQNVVDLGSRRYGGYIIVGFADETQTGQFPEGSTVTIYTLGQDMCPDSDFIDQPYALQALVSKDLYVQHTFLDYGIGMGPYIIPVWESR